ncbi:MAG: GNAT family N-acetyltransferase [bacterium]|nr:GNAT family N-acetyltransferase [bacterium]
MARREHTEGPETVESAPEGHVIVSEQLRELSDDDLAALQSFIPDALNSQSAEGMAEYLPDIVSADSAALFVVRNPAGRIVGATVANIDYCMSKRRGKIDDVAVDSEWRRQGYASTVLDDALAWLRAQGVAKVQLNSEHELVEAHALYRSRGFELYDTNVFVLKF